jgi:KDO2-lipid IV(A) lauroyltransferase
MRLVHLCLYLCFRAAEAAMRLVPLTWVFIIGRCAGAVAFALLGNRRRIARLNLALAFGTAKTDGEIRALVREHFRSLGANLFSSLKLATMRQEDIWQRVTLEKPPTLAIPPPAERTGWIAMISHLGNWELFGHLAPMFPEYRFGAFYQRLANPFIDQRYRELRGRSGTELFDRREGYLRGIRFLRSGGVVGVLVDQSAGRAGLWTPLFGRLASCSPLAAMLSTRTGLPVVPIAIHTAGLARWRVVLSEPIHPDPDHPDAMELLTARINRELERQIAQAPADWLWSHNRWKPLRPRFLLANDPRRFFFPPDFERATLQPFRLLVRSPNSEVQADAALPAIRAMKKARPDVWLAILATKPLAEFWRNRWEVDSVIMADPSEPLHSTVGKIHEAGRFDAALVFSDSLWSALEVFVAGIPLRVGQRAGFARHFFNQHFPATDDPVGSAAYYLQAARSIGADVSPDS